MRLFKQRNLCVRSIFKKFVDSIKHNPQSLQLRSVYSLLQNFCAFNLSLFFLQTLSRAKRIVAGMQ